MRFRGIIARLPISGSTSTSLAAKSASLLSNSASESALVFQLGDELLPVVLGAYSCRVRLDRATSSLLRHLLRRWLPHAPSASSSTSDCGQLQCVIDPQTQINAWRGFRYQKSSSEELLGLLILRAYVWESSTNLPVFTVDSMYLLPKKSVS